MSNLNNNIAAAVNAALLSSNFSEYDGDGGKTNRLLTGVLLYKYLENAVQVDSSQLGKINSLANEYLGNYRQEVEEMRFLYASYFVIRKRFELWGTEIFYDLSSAKLEEVRIS